jgi:hypothetical protein
MARKRLGEILVEAGVLDEARLRAALGEQRRWGGPLGRLLVDMRFVTEDILVDALSRQLGLPMIKLEGRSPDPKALELVPYDLAMQHQIVPLQADARFLDVATSDPTNLGILDELRVRTRLNVRPYLAGPKSLEKTIRSWYMGKPGGTPVLGIPEAVAPRDPPRDTGIARDAGVARARRQGLEAEAAEQLAPAAAKAPGGSLGGPEISLGLGAQNQQTLEIQALQARVQALEALVQRDEDVLRKLFALLIDKGLCTREEILERIR